MKLCGGQAKWLKCSNINYRLFAVIKTEVSFKTTVSKQIQAFDILR